MCLNRPWGGHPFDSDGGAQNSNPTLSHDLNDPTATLARTTAAQNILYCVRLLRRTARCPNSLPIAAQGTTPVPRHPPSVKNVSDQVRRPSTFAITDRRTEKITGHFTYECKDTRPYVSRPSRTAQLENPQLLLAAAKSKADEDSSSVPDEFKNKFVFSFSFSVVKRETRCVFSYSSLVLIGAELRIGSWRQRRSKERRRRRIERRNGRSGRCFVPLQPPFSCLLFLLRAGLSALLSAAEPSQLCG